MFGKIARHSTAVVLDIQSASAGVAILALGETTHVISLQRESLPLEERVAEASLSGVLKCIETAGQRALQELTASEWAGKSASPVYAIVGMPWSRSAPAHAERTFKTETVITDALIKELAQEAMAAQTELDVKNLIEASVVRVKLNGYPIAEPVGKKAKTIELFTVASDCESKAKAGIQELAVKLFPHATITWRSSARASLAVVRESIHEDSCLIVDVNTEGTDLIVDRKGVLDKRSHLDYGALAMLLKFGSGKPPEETLSLLEMLSGEQCEGEACDALRDSIAKAEPEFVRVFGEAMANFAATQRLPNNLVLIAPVHLQPWLSEFFSRIDFSQFTMTTQPFSVATIPLASVGDDKRILDDPGLSIGAALMSVETTR